MLSRFIPHLPEHGVFILFIAVTLTGGAAQRSPYGAIAFKWKIAFPSVVPFQGEFTKSSYLIKALILDLPVLKYLML